MLRLTSVLAALLVCAAACDEDDPADSGATDAGRLADGAPIDVGSSGDGGAGVTTCVIIQSRERMCTRGGNATLVDVYSCELGDACRAPSPYNEEFPDIMCVDAYRFDRFEYPATCEQVDEFYAGTRDCLVPSHCAGSEVFGDWICSLTDGCVCPSGGTCPEPLPPPPSDGGVDAGGLDGGVFDAGVSDAGVSDAGVLDAGTDAGDPPPPMDAGGPPPPPPPPP